MQLARKYYKLLLIALNDPEQWVAQVTYIDRSGNVTDRAVSPVRMHLDAMQVHCLGRDGLRTMNYERVLRVRLRHACDVLAPEGVADLVRQTSGKRWACEDPGVPWEEG